MNFAKHRVVVEPEFEEVTEFSEGLAGFATNLDWEAFAAAVHRWSSITESRGDFLGILPGTSRFVDG